MKPLVVGHCDFNENQSEMEQKIEKWNFYKQLEQNVQQILSNSPKKA